MEDGLHGEDKVEGAKGWAAPQRDTWLPMFTGEKIHPAEIKHFRLINAKLITSLKKEGVDRSHYQFLETNSVKFKSRTTSLPLTKL